MPTLFGREVSPDVYALNQSVAKSPPNHRCPAVKLWNSEREFQAAVIEAARWEATQCPAFKQLFHIPNENSHRTPGVRGGVPDLFLAVPSAGKAGLFIELKVADGKLSQAQQNVISDLRSNGYAVAVIWNSVSEVIDCIKAYLRM